MEAYKISNPSDICHDPKIGTALRFCHLQTPVELLFVRDVLRHRAIACRYYPPLPHIVNYFVLFQSQFGQRGRWGAYLAH